MLDVVRIKAVRAFRIEHSHWEVQSLLTGQRISRHETRAGAKARLELEIERRKLARESKNND